MKLSRLLGKIKLNSYLHPSVVLLLDVLVSFVASIFSMLLLLTILPDHLSFGRQFIISWLLLSILLSALSFYVWRSYRSIIRYSNLKDIGRIFVASLTKVLGVWGGVVLMSCTPPLTGSIIGIVFVDLLFTSLLLVMLRVCMLVAYDYIRGRVKRERVISRVLIYGVDEDSVGTVTKLSGSSEYRVRGFIVPSDGSKSYQVANMNIYRFGSKDDVLRCMVESGADGILFTRVADARTESDRLVSYCRETRLKIFILPDIDDITDTNGLKSFIRPIKIEDLLGREEIRISMEAITRELTGSVVMVTGAAGSIGSEIVRQIAAMKPQQLVLFDNAETPLHNLRLQLQNKFPGLNFVPVIGDVRSYARLEYVFATYRPQYVFHAAAYKHVPLMEENPCEAVRVNVVGSKSVADLCLAYDVTKMVMISTDKAVNPTNIMGCTKRLAEMYVQSLGLAVEQHEKEGRTTFVTTRFGNVLGSNGSVIPHFRAQIENGGPVTVTHPEIERFFMTIPEACRLVLEAAIYASSTQIFVFDMGESVKIRTLAERMIQLAGLEPGKDIQIEYTGLRPGEKLYEEVLATEENTTKTPHDRIFVAKVRAIDYQSILEVVNALERYSSDVAISEMVHLMKETVPEFHTVNPDFADM